MRRKSTEQEIHAFPVGRAGHRPVENPRKKYLQTGGVCERVCSPLLVNEARRHGAKARIRFPFYASENTMPRTDNAAPRRILGMCGEGVRVWARNFRMCASRVTVVENNDWWAQQDSMTFLDMMLTRFVVGSKVVVPILERYIKAILLRSTLEVQDSSCTTPSPCACPLQKSLWTTSSV